MFGPFLQCRFTGLLEQTFPEEDIAIFGCNPIQNSLMVVTSENGSDKKIHSASNAPFLMSTSFSLVNRAQLMQKNSRIYIGFLNEAENSLAATDFLSTNRADIDKISVDYKNDGSFVIAVGDIYPGDIIVGYISAMYPTAAFIDVRTDKTSARDILNPGDCSNDYLKLKGPGPEQFYEEYDFSEPSTSPGLVIDDIIGPIGPVIFERVFHYNCGEGLREAIFQVIPSKGESMDICGNSYNNTGS